MTSYHHRKSHCGDKTILRPSYLHNGISYTGKTTSLYWIGAQMSDSQSTPPILPSWASFGCLLWLFLRTRPNQNKTPSYHVVYSTMLLYGQLSIKYISDNVTGHMGTNHLLPVNTNCGGERKVSSWLGFPVVELQFMWPEFLKMREDVNDVAIYLPILKWY